MQRVKAQGRGAAAAQWADEVRALHKVAIVQHTAAAGFCLTGSHLRPTAWHRDSTGAAGAGGPRLLPTGAGRHMRAKQQQQPHATDEEAEDSSKALFRAHAELKEGDQLPPKAVLPEARCESPARPQPEFSSKVEAFSVFPTQQLRAPSGLNNTAQCLLL